MTTETEIATPETETEAPAQTAPRVSFPTRIEAVADDMSDRYALNNILISRAASCISRAWACATEGRMLAAIPLDDCGIPPGTMIPAKPVGLMRKLVSKLNRRKPDAWHVEVDERSVKVRSTGGLVVEGMVGEGRLPRSLPEALVEVPEDEYCQVSIDADLLHRLADALTEDGERKEIALFIPKNNPNKAIGVRGTRGIGTLMCLQHEPSRSDRDRYHQLRSEFAEAFRHSHEATR